MPGAIGPHGIILRACKILKYFIWLKLKMKEGTGKTIKLNMAFNLGRSGEAGPRVKGAKRAK